MSANKNHILGSVSRIMPKGAGILFFIQIFSTLSFSVLYSSLVLYMTQALGISKVSANTITGIFIAFNFGLHLLGGFFGGRLLSNRSLFGIGMLCQVLGCLLISVESVQFLYWGLGAFLTGSGLNVTCINCMLTQRFSPEDKSREAAFLWNYSGMNVGFFMGFSISGYFQLNSDYGDLFILSSLGNLIALFILFYHWPKLKDMNTPLTFKHASAKRMYNLLGVLTVIAMIPALAIVIKSADISNALVNSVAALMVCVLVTLAFQQPQKAARQKMLAFIGLMFASLVFWTLYQIAPMGLTLFIKHNVDSQLFGILIPPQWVQNINTIVIVIGGPVLSVVFNNMRAKGININIPVQFAIALALIGIAFAILPLGISLANKQGLTHFNWIIASYFLQSVGELFISPIGYAMVGQLAPSNLQGIMMGSWMMVTGVAATLSGHFSNMMVGVGDLNIPHITNQSFAHTFNLLGWGAIIAAIVLYSLAPVLSRLIRAQSHTQALEAV